MIVQIENDVTRIEAAEYLGLKLTWCLAYYEKATILGRTDDTVVDTSGGQQPVRIAASAIRPSGRRSGDNAVPGLGQTRSLCAPKPCAVFSQRRHVETVQSVWVGIAGAIFRPLI